MSVRKMEMTWKPGERAERAVKREHPVLPGARVSGKVPRREAGLELTLLRAVCPLVGVGGMAPGAEGTEVHSQSQGGAGRVLETVGGVSDGRPRVD